MKKIIAISLIVLPFILMAQPYKPDWESLDTRPVPQWFKDAKFGIFIHWGVYAVPGWSTKGNYAEWYQNGLQTNDTARIKFHKAKFGDRSYYDLAKDFKAELFSPDEWAKLFEQSGAKYIVLTSKHHDGFALWPSQEANKTWGFKWNAMDIGPKRDLVGDLFKAVRKTSVHAGMYYSLYEWFNPLWKSDKQRFVAEHTWPQMRDLINTYRPDVFWTDGDWDATPETWKSQEFLSWLYNESPVKDKIVVNDRWGSGVRFHHGGIYTPEYQPDLDFEDHYWEESRGMGYSYGYNREEDAWDYNSSRSLVLQLIDKVSRGGNFLLDIGPDEHGKIPPIMQERLLQIGDWLKVNGEAIYGASRWKESCQWSEGRKDYKNRSGDMLLKITVDPDPGFAVKELFYTYNEKTNSLYAIFPQYPENKKIVLKNTELPASTTIHFLSTKESLAWKQNGSDLEISLPEYNPGKIKAPDAYVIKIENYGRFIAKPLININYKPGALKPVVTINIDPGTAVFYTIDGSTPGPQSTSYKLPFSPDSSCTVRAIARIDGSLENLRSKVPSSVAVAEVKTYSWMNPVKVSMVKSGITYNYFEPPGSITMNFITQTPIQSGLTDNISLSKKQRPDKFAFEFIGYIKIEKSGIYTFSTESDDGSKLLLDDKEIVNNDGEHGSVEKTGKAGLKKGYHRFKILYFDSGGGNELKAYLQPEGGKKVEIPSSILFH